MQDPFATPPRPRVDYRARSAGRRLATWTVMLFIAAGFGLLYLSWVLSAMGGA